MLAEKITSKEQLIKALADELDACFEQSYPVVDLTEQLAKSMGQVGRVRYLRLLRHLGQMPACGWSQMSHVSQMFQNPHLSHESQLSHSSQMSHETCKSRKGAPANA